VASLPAACRFALAPIAGVAQPQRGQVWLARRPCESDAGVMLGFARIEINKACAGRAICLLIRAQMGGPSDNATHLLKSDESQTWANE
jgi:hypothetical protein